MSVERKPNGRYLARWRDPSGKQRAKYFGRKLDAGRFLATVTVDQLAGRYVDPNAGKVTVAAFAASWAAGQPWRESTRRSRETGDRAPDRPGVRTGRAAGRVTVGCSGVGRSPYGFRACRVQCRRVLPSARTVDERRASRSVIHESPCVGVRLPRADRAASSLTVLSAGQVAALTDEVPSRYRALVVASAGLGLRQGEACALTVDRVDFLRRKVTIDRQVVTPAKGSVCYFGPPKTPSSNRVIPLPSVVAEALAAHIAEHGEGPDRLIFTTTRGAMIARQTWLAGVQRRREASRDRGVHP